MEPGWPELRHAIITHMPALYLVGTPIGNLEDISFRAIRTLREVDLIAAEDTRKTRKLLAAYEIRTPVTSYYEQGKKVRLTHIMGLLKQKNIAIVSEAGMPGISDPGYDLVRQAVGSGITVIPVPGPSAVTTAVAVSGLPADQFVYVGFLPRKTGDRKSLLKSIASEIRSIVAFEAPHRLLVSLSNMIEILGDRRIAVSRELTKVHEEVFRGTVSQAIAHFAQPRGEFTLVISGAGKSTEAPVPEWVVEELRSLRLEGIPAKQAIAYVSRHPGLRKKDLYRTWLTLP